MIPSVIQELGPWNWWILALILMGLEIVVPGTFFLWFGISAFVIGTISLAVGADSTFWVWQTQVIGFVVLSLVSALAGRRFLNQFGLNQSDNPTLNERGAQMVGRTGVVSQSIEGGMGRARIGETTWRVSGPDLPAGTEVRVVDQQSGLLIVEEERQSQ
ncbi:MAG: membrane protein [Alphaproteobacteria bacterium]|nr:MAG: membrane protein [Alphaproteobacteria bacterium]